MFFPIHTRGGSRGSWGSACPLAHCTIFPQTIPRTTKYFVHRGNNHERQHTHTHAHTRTQAHMQTPHTHAHINTHTHTHTHKSRGPRCQAALKQTLELRLKQSQSCDVITCPNPHHTRGAFTHSLKQIKHGKDQSGQQTKEQGGRTARGLFFLVPLSSGVRLVTQVDPAIGPCSIYAGGWPPAQWRHFASGLEMERSQPFGLTGRAARVH